MTVSIVEKIQNLCASIVCGNNSGVVEGFKELTTLPASEIKKNAADLFVLFSLMASRCSSELDNEILDDVRRLKREFAMFLAEREINPVGRFCDYEKTRYDEGVFTADRNELQEPILYTHENRHIEGANLMLTEKYYFGSNGLKFRELLFPEMGLSDPGFLLNNTLLSDRLQNLEALLSFE